MLLHPQGIRFLTSLMFALTFFAVSVLATTGDIYCGKPPKYGVLSNTYSCDAKDGFSTLPAFQGAGGYVAPVHIDYIHYLKYGTPTACPEPCTTRHDLTYPGGGVCRSFTINEDSTPFSGGAASSVSFQYTGWYFENRDDEEKGSFLLCNVACRGPKSMTC